MADAPRLSKAYNQVVFALFQAVTPVVELPVAAPAKEVGPADVLIGSIGLVGVLALLAVTAGLLIGAGMPSVLAEIAFISHDGEGGLLRTEKYRQRIAEALAAAVIRYTRTLKPVGTVAAQK